MTQFRGCAASLKHGEGVKRGPPEKYTPKTFLDFPHWKRENRVNRRTFRVIFWSLLIAKQIQIGQYGQGFFRLNFQRIIRNCVVNMKSHDSHLILEHLGGHLRILIPKLPEIFQWTLRPPMTRRRKPGPVTVARYHFNCQLARASKTDEKRLKHGVPKKFNVDSVISLLFYLFPAESLWWWIFLELADSLIFSPYFLQ